jgi:methionyl-tRNA formyltransferase
MRILIVTQRKYLKYAQHFVKHLALFNLGAATHTVIYEDHRNAQPEIFDVAISLLYDRIIEENVLELPRFGWINIHPSLLPQHRGSTPNVWQVIHGDGGGWTAHRMGKRVDWGMTYYQHRVPVYAWDTGESVYLRHLDALILFLEQFARRLVSNIQGWWEESEETGQHLTEPPYRANRMKDFETHRCLGNWHFNKWPDVIRAYTFTGYDGAYYEVEGATIMIKAEVQYR